MKTSSLTVIVEDRRWRKVRAQVKRAALAALARAGEDKPFTVLLTTDKKLHALNRDFRGRDKPTNVLSFPSRDPAYLGDIAIAYGIAAKEARAEKKAFAHHAAHLAVHGVLHLLGYDHIRARDAKVMEPLEIEILAGLGIPNPYWPEAA